MTAPDFVEGAKNQVTGVTLRYISGEPNVSRATPAGGAGQDWRGCRSSRTKEPSE
jgi:hypothetical protein